MPNTINNESNPQKSIQFGIVGKGIKNFNEVILTDVKLGNKAKATEKNDENIVDKFTQDDYLGSDTLLNSAYASNGDNTDLHLVKLITKPLLPTQFLGVSKALPRPA